MVGSDVGKLLEGFKNLRIAVLGDLILDKYVFGRVERISPEAPVPVFEIEKEEFRAGGAANVSLNLKALGVGEVALLGRVGRDAEGEILRSLVERAGVKPFLTASETVPTIRKTRLVARSQQLIRIDREVRVPLGEGEEAELKRFLDEFQPDAVVVSDYAKGVFTEGLSNFLRERGFSVFVDPRPKNWKLYRGFLCTTPNRKEFSEMLNLAGIGGEDFQRGAFLLKKLLGLEKLVITLSDKGIALVGDGEFKVFPATAKEVYDVTGAGDTVIAVLSAVVSVGGDWETACKLANLAAGIVVGKLGTATVEKGELLRAIEEHF